jgi:Putative Actinobacterial Holin-X, holin superfamily III
MEKAFAKAEELAGTIKDYVNNRIESAKLNAAEKTSAVAANIIAATIAAMVLLIFVVLASIAIALVLGDLIGNTWAGFAIVACLYLFAAIWVWVARDKLIRFKIMNDLIEQLFKPADDEED